MKTLVIGGTGFLGRYIVPALLGASQQVSVLSRNPEKLAGRLPAGVAALRGDLNTLSSARLKKLLRGFDGLVYAAGADERTRPEGPARDFYFRENVQVCKKVLLAAQQSSITHCVVLNSIFTHMNRSQPELALAKKHSYIASRIAQSEMAIDVAKGHFTQTVLEVPWVFGHSGDQPSQWAPLVHYARSATPLTCPRGGAIAISAENIGQATLGALSRPQNAQGLSLPIGDALLSWDEMIKQFALASGRHRVSIQRIPDRVFSAMSQCGALALAVIGEDTGLDFARMHEFLLTQMDADLKRSQQLLNYSPSNINAALAATVDSVPEFALQRGWRKLVLNAGLQQPLGSLFTQQARLA